MLWQNDSPAARERFWSAVHEYASGRYLLQDAVAVDKYTALCEEAIGNDNVLSVSLLWCVLPMPLHGLRRSALRVAGPAGAGACFVKVGGAGKRAEATARPERAVRSGAAYFAASTRVLCGKYSSIPRRVLLRTAHPLLSFPDFTRHFFVL